MRISVFGLGYVGAVTAGCLASRGHTIVGVDVHPQKIEDLNRGQAPIIEPGLGVLLERGHGGGLIRATGDSMEAVAETEVSIVCVGTPSAENGTLDLTFVRQVIDQIGAAVRQIGRSHALILRSTMLPGSTRLLTEEKLKDLTEAGLLPVYYYPEFLREGTAIRDFQEPSLSVIGTPEGEPPPEAWASLLGKNLRITRWEAAEMLKYACNAFHATKIAFANEMGRLGKVWGVDGKQVMALLCEDQRLNISPAYLRPGTPFGGSCLPKDLRAVTGFVRQQGIHLPLTESLLTSNEEHAQALLKQIKASGLSDIVILGLSFKHDTDDLRESPMVELAQNLLGRGYRVRIYDPQLNLSALIGSNKRVIDTKMPHLASLLHEDLVSAVGEEGLVVVAQPCTTIAELAKALTPRHRVLDVNGWADLKGLPFGYESFCS